MNLDKIKKYFLGFSILGAYYSFGILFQLFIFGCVTYFNPTDFWKFLIIMSLVSIEAIFFTWLYDYIKRDFFDITEYKKTGMPTNRVFKLFHYLENIENKILLVMVYLPCFILIVLIGGTVVTTILFRKNEAHPGFLNKETLVYFIPACTISVITKYFGFAKLPMMVWVFLKNLYLQAA